MELTGVLIALIVLTIVLAGVFLVRPSITVGATGKILAFVGLCVLPALCIGTGMSFHMQRSQQTAYCISCHSMETHGQSLYVLNANYIPAQHFQNHLVPPDKACYTCHTDYTMYGPLKDKLKGLKYLYMEYVSTPPKTIHLDRHVQQLAVPALPCGHPRALRQIPATRRLWVRSTNQISCISCHNTIHNASEVDHLKMWIEGVRANFGHCWQPRQPQRNRLRQPDHRKRQLEVRQAMQPPPRGRPFLILKAALDATERAGVAALGQP